MQEPAAVPEVGAEKVTMRTLPLSVVLKDPLEQLVTADAGLGVRLVNPENTVMAATRNAAVFAVLISSWFLLGDFYTCG